MHMGDDDFSSPFPVLTLTSSEEEEDDLQGGDFSEPLPLLPLRNMVMFPKITLPIMIGREKSRALIRHIEKTNGYFVCVAQKEMDVEDPEMKDLYEVGVLCRLTRLLELPNGATTAIAKGLTRFRVSHLIDSDPFLTCQGGLIPEMTSVEENDKEYHAMAQTIREMSSKTITMMTDEPPRELIESIQEVGNEEYAINFAASSLNVKLFIKQALLETSDVKARGFEVLNHMQKYLQLLELKANIKLKTREELDKQQKEYFLQQQIRTIQEELGGNINELEIAELRKTASTKKWRPEVGEIFEKELSKLERIHPQSPDYSVQMQYVQTIVSLPWDTYSPDRFLPKKAESILNRDHFGLEQVKERILEHLAVLKLKKDMKSPILCLYGPPGVGKTSLGKSIAECLGREYVRISLGGLHDEAEIRGHRRTYIGAMCGRIIKGLQKAGTSNPVFVLDEIDKIDSDFKGDPSSALLEVLDPEQNSAFHDNFLDIDYDLSKVLFIATANSLSTISQPLRDRMEIIQVDGYILEEKIEIAKRHLIPKAIEEHGLSASDLKFSKKAIESIIEGYTKESGVRGLQKQIASVVRKEAKKVAFDEECDHQITPEVVRTLLKAPIFTRDMWKNFGVPGVVTGLAWTSVGGEILFIESSKHPGKDAKLTLTGNLGAVMKESAVIALDYIRAHAKTFGVDLEKLEQNDIHIHVPEGAIPKDGPSAGITMITSLVSMLTDRKVKPRIAMTGEITLSGRVLPVGGIKEKILAARRAGIVEIILSEENKKDIQEIQEIYIKGITFHYINRIEELIDLALEPAKK